MSPDSNGPKAISTMEVGAPGRWFESSLDAMTLLDPETLRILDCNAAFARAAGVGREGVAGMSLAETCPEFQTDGTRSEVSLARAVARTLELGSHRAEWLAKRAGGGCEYLDVVLTKLEFRGREAVLTSARNIDPQKKAEEDLRVSEARWRRVFEQLPMSMQIFSPEGLSLRINEAFRRLFGPIVPDVGNFNIRTDAQLAAAGLSEYVERAFAGEVVSIPSIPFELKVGPREARGVKWIGSTMFPVFDAGNHLIEVVCVHEDETARKQAEAEITEMNLSLEQRIAERTEALRESEQKFRMLFLESSQGVMLHDEHMNFSEVNPAAAALFGLPADEFTGRHPAEFAAEFQPNGERSDEVARREIQRCQREGTARFEWTHLHADGHEVALDVVLSRIQHGEKNLMQAVVTDISERKRAEQELKRALERERELNQLKSNFVSMVSHEFRTPLGIIQSSAEILDDYLERLDVEERSEQLQSIIKNSRRMAGLMEDVLLLGRLDSGRMEFLPGPLDLAALCRRLVDEVRSTTDARCPIGFSTADLPAEALADERLLRHILLNLLTNAVKYSPPGEPVRFRAAACADELVFEVIDHGIGIPQADLPGLFGAFRRGSNVGQTPGTGLGLVIVKQSVDLHGGRIEVADAPGGGTRFTVGIPLTVQSVQ